MMEDIQRNISGKLEQIREHLEMTAGSMIPSVAPEQKRKSIAVAKVPGHKVGIFSMDQSDVGWLQTPLSSPPFSGLVEKIRNCTFQDKKKLKRKVSKSTFCILSSDRRNGKHLLSSIDKDLVMKNFVGKPLIVVIGGVQDISEAESLKILKSLSIFHCLSRGLLLFTRPEVCFLAGSVVFSYLSVEVQMNSPFSALCVQTATFSSPLSTPRSRVSTIISRTVFTHPSCLPENTDHQKPPANHPSEVRDRQKDMTLNSRRCVRAATFSAPLSAPRPQVSTIARRSVNTHLSCLPESTDHQKPPANHPSEVRGRQIDVIPKSSSSKSGAGGKKPPAGEKQKVWIFSRSASSDYSWLNGLLTSEHFRDRILSVQSCYISNTGFQKFFDAVARCTFAILYHTKNRGAINVTDVTGSLYDWELEYLQKMLGRDNVMVVIDDLESSSDLEKRRILISQPSIGRLAGHLLLMSQSDKDNSMSLVKKMRSVEQFQQL